MCLKNRPVFTVLINTVFPIRWAIKAKAEVTAAFVFACQKRDSIYLGYIYPKTGSGGKDNLEKEDYKAIATSIQKAIETNNLYALDIEKCTYAKVK